MTTTKQRRAARIVHVYVDSPTREKVDELARQLDGWHAMTYPSTPGAPVELAFFDHAKADEACSQALSLHDVKNAGVFHTFEVGRDYRSIGKTPHDDCVFRCVRKRGAYVDLVPVGSQGPGGTALRKKLRVYDKCNLDRGEYVQIDARRSVYAANDGDD